MLRAKSIYENNSANNKNLTLINLLKDHDWFYDMSDDHRTWKKGEKEREEIYDLLKTLEPSLAKEIWEKYAPVSPTGKQFEFPSHIYSTNLNKQTNDESSYEVNFKTGDEILIEIGGERILGKIIKTLEPKFFKVFNTYYGEYEVEVESSRYNSYKQGEIIKVSDNQILNLK